MTALIMLLAASAVAAQDDSSTLARFLVKAKAEGYASGIDSRIRRVSDGASEVSSSDGRYSYRDRWYGGAAFTGEEIVWRDGKPAWSMNFYGSTADGARIPEEFPKFHKAALRHAPVEAPYRGPALYREGDFVYVNDVTGSLAAFSGIERVFFRDREIFRLSYHGGMLRD